MKRWKWLAAMAAITACVVLFLNKDDLGRFKRMRHM
jgi:hypothetical protein